MNESLYNRLCEPGFLYDSWLRVARKNGTSGVDGKEVHGFSVDLEKNLKKIAYALQNEDYEPSPLRSVCIPKERQGNFRRLGIPTVQDRIVFQGVNRLLQEIWTPRFSPLSFAYRPGTGVADAIQAVSDFIVNGRHWFAKGDIRGCFDSLDWEILSCVLKEWLPDNSLRKLINKAVRVPVVTGGRILPRYKGVPQGSPLSPILANLYLHQFDYEMTVQRFPPIRYGDDWVILTYNESEAADGFKRASAALSALSIDINAEKSHIGSLEEQSIVFLGHKINASAIDAGPNGWRRFARAVAVIKNARGPEASSQAREELARLKSFYRSAGRIR